MACSASTVSTATPSNTQLHEVFENRSSGLLQPRETLTEITWDSKSTPSSVAVSHYKDLKTRFVTAISNTVRNVAVIEATRFLAIVGLVCSAVASVLLPMLGFAAIAVSACVLKNRAIQLDKKNLGNSDIQEVVNETLSRSSSIRSQINQASSNGSEGAFLNPISEEVFQEPDIKEAFLDSLGDRKNFSMKEAVEKRYDLLTICYAYLRGKIGEMPQTLGRGLVKEHKTQIYFEKKFNDYFSKTSQAFKDSSISSDDKVKLNVNNAQNSLKEANPSLIMEIVKELHQEISQEYHKQNRNDLEKNHAKNAAHAEEYIAQLKKYEHL